jgi:hypothetical protein
LSSKKKRGDWEISKLYFEIWDKNQTQIIDRNSKEAARRILRVDLRRSFPNLSKLLVNYPLNFNKKNSNIFKRIFGNVFLYYFYLFIDTWSDFLRICKKG